MKSMNKINKHSLRLFCLMILLLGLNIKLLCQEKNHYIIDNVEYTAMLDGYCAMASLQMNLDYYDFSIDQSLLLNLGWNYGFMYIKSPYYTIAYPDTDPVEEIVFACNLLGFSTTVLTFSSLKEARETLVKNISQDIPVIVQWIPHTILAFGYRDSASSIIYHDPGDYRNQNLNDLYKNDFGKGEEVFMPVSDWEKIPYMWGMRQYQMVIIEPEDKKINIDWKEVWKRNAEKTLGRIKNPYPAIYGIDGIAEMTKDIENSIKQNIPQSVAIIKNCEMCFKLGVGFRRNAAAFISGQAAVFNEKNLSLASKEFLRSANYFRKGINFINWLKINSEQELNGQTLYEFVEILKQIIECEKNGADYLLKASSQN